MLKKDSSEGIPCTYCEEKAIKGTDPPVCAKHRKLAKKSSKAKTLKELEAMP